MVKDIGVDIKSEVDLGCKYGKLLTFDMKVSRTVSAITRYWEFKGKKAINCIVSNLASCIQKDKHLVYSRGKGRDGVSKKGLTVYRTVEAVDWLHEEGWVITIIGVSSPYVEDRVISKIYPTQKFLNLFIGKEKQLKEIEMDYLDSADVVVLRDNLKEVAKYYRNDFINEITQGVKDLNLLNYGLDIRDKDGVPMDNIYCRIFNETFDFGGRYYRADILTLSNKNNERLNITIDGEPVVEVDYSSLHVRIASAIEGLHLDRLGKDAYINMLGGNASDTDRKIVKLATNIMFNCDTKQKAYGAIQSIINKFDEKDKAEYSLGKPSSVVNLIQNTYPELDKHFCKNGVFGKILQNADSHLASDNIRDFVLQRKPILPIHDSFIAKKKDLDFLCSVMGNNFRKRFNVDSPVPMTIKYVEDGDLVRRVLMEYN